MVNVLDVLNQIDGIRDDRTGLSVLDLGLIYSVSIPDAGHVSISMTMMPPDEPLNDAFMDFEEEAVTRVYKTVRSAPGVTAASVDLVWSPPWKADLMNDRARALLSAELGGTKVNADAP